MKQYLWLPMVAFLFYSCTGPTFPENPRLVVFMVVDQLPSELMHRIESEFTGGFKWLLDHGVDFRNAHHEHAYTVTGTGYFTIGSGRYPGPAGVLGNSWYDRELNKTVNCVEDSTAKPIGGLGKARSYNQTDATAIGDWMKKRNPESKVYTVSAKDRASVFLGGKNADLPIYYNWNGTFLTSDYYTDKLPVWLSEINQLLDVNAYRDSVWSHLREMDIYDRLCTDDDFFGEVDSFNKEYSPTLPKSLSSIDLEKTGDYLVSMPWYEKIILNIATTAIEKEELGKDEIVDLLGIGFSSADWIGHNHGPNSHEVLDYFLRLDQYLMKFINNLDKSIGLENVLFVLSSDHGVGPLPEYLRTQGIDSDRLDRPAFKEKIENIKKWSKNAINYSGVGFYFPVDYSNEQKSAALIKIKEELADIKAIEKVMTRTDIIALTGNDSFSRRMRNMIHPEKSPDVIIVIREYYSERYPAGATHGTPYDYDTHVPIIFSHESIQSQKVNRAVATVDIAPTIARIVSVQIPSDVDGLILPEVIK